MERLIEIKEKLQNKNLGKTTCKKEVKDYER